MGSEDWEVVSMKMTKHRIYILIVAVLWIGFLVVLHLQKQGSGNAESRAQDTGSPSVRKEPATSQTAEIPKRVTNSTGMEFVYVPPGTFMMGSPLDEQGRYDRETAHEVTLTRGFYMQTTEVTQKQWEMVMKRNPSFFRNCDACPVEQVSWNEIQRFIWKLNQIEGLNTYSLPTEAEWEYACRAGTATRFNWGDEADCSKANYGVAFIRSECKGKNPGKTMTVMSYPPNAWGLHDMHGNVAEWCLDRFDAYALDHTTDPAGAYATVDRVYRGGSWGVASRYCRSGNRDSGTPNTKLSDLGFRLVKAVSGYMMRGVIDPYPLIQPKDVR